MEHANIYLIGFMGAGKTTLGTQLALALKRPFIDSDDLIEQRAQRSLANLVTQEGESRLRQYEAEVFKELSATRNLVVASGGGAVLDANTRHRLKSSGYLVYLKLPLDTHKKRLKNCKHRPLLNQDDKTQQSITELYQQREPIYRSHADLMLNAETLSVTEAVSILKNLLIFNQCSRLYSFNTL